MTPDPFDLARAEVMLAGYDTRWSEDMERLEVLAVEVEFSAPLVNPDSGAPSRTWTLAGKLDAVVRELDGQRRTLLVEHKTASGEVGPGSDYLKRLRMDGQISVYYAGAAALGYPVDGALYDVLVKPALRPLKATPPEARKFTKDGQLYKAQRLEDETPEEYRDRVAEAVAPALSDYFVRAEVVRLEDEMRDAMADVWQLGRVMRENELAGRAPRNPDSCVRYGRTCDFFPVCSGEASVDDPSLYRRADLAHPELAEEPRDLAVLTASRLASYRACARLHHLRYDLMYRPAVEAETLRFGTLIHAGLAAWWQAPRGASRLDAAMEAIQPSSTAAATAA